MAGGGRNRREQNRWNDDNRRDSQQITQVDPGEQEYRNQQLAYLKWKNTPGRDVRDAPGLSDNIQIGQAAIARANQDRMGTGALQLAEGGASGYAQNLKSLRSNEMGQQVGVGLENALAARNAEATGSVLPLAQLSTNRNIAKAGNSAQMFGMWSQRKTKNWWDYLTEAGGLASRAAGAGGGGG